MRSWLVLWVAACVPGGELDEPFGADPALKAATKSGFVFDRRGARIAPELGAPVTLSLVRWGRDGRAHPVGPVDPQVEASRSVYRRPGLDEWYVPTEGGLEQGFTVHAPPEGDGPLALTVAFETERALYAGEGYVQLADPQGDLVYRELYAFDAAGRSLPSTLDTRLLASNLVELWVDDTDAVYPITIDPETGPDDCPTDPAKTEPGYCGCDYLDVDTGAPVGPDACVHRTATVSGTIEPDVRIEAGAVVGAGAIVRAGATVSPRAVVSSNARIGEDSFVGRRAFVGVGSRVGPNSYLAPDVHVGTDLDAELWDVTVGYGAVVGDRVEITGPGVLIGNLASIGDDVVLGADVNIGRNSSIGDGVVLGDNTRIGPDVSIASLAVIGSNVKIRKGSTIGKATIEDGVSIGRDVEIRDDAVIEANAVLRANVVVGRYATVDGGAVIPRGTVIPDVDIGVDNAPVVVITSPSDGASNQTGSFTISGTCNDDYGVVSLNYRVDDGAEQAITCNSNGTFSAAVTFPVGTGSIRVTAVDDEGQRGSDVLLLSGCGALPGIEKTWTGTASTNWSDASNWTPSGVPATTDDVYICAGALNPPSLTAASAVKDLQMDGGATLSLGTFNLTSSGNVAAGTVTSTSGKVILSGSGTLRGTVPNLDVTQTTTLNGYTHATGNVTLLAGDVLNINGRTMQIDGSYTQTHNATTDGLRLNQALSEVIVAGSATFNGSLAMNSTAMNAGVLRVRGGFSAPSSVAAFAPTGTLVVLDGTAPQTLTIGSVGGSSGNRFYDLEIANTNVSGVSASVASGQAVYVARNLTIRHLGRLTVNSSTNTLQVGQKLELNGTSTLHAATTQLDAGLVMSVNAAWTGTTTRLMTQLPNFAPGYAVTNTRVVGGVTLTAPWTGTLPNLYVEPGGFLRPNGNTFVYTGSFTSTHNATTDGLRLNWAGDDVTLNGPATFTGSLAMNSTAMNGGTLRLKGSFSAPSSVAAFAPTGTKVVFEGTSLQSLTIGNSAGPSGNRFYDLEFRNPAGMNVSLVGGGALYTGRHLTVGTGGSLSVGATTNTVQVGGTLTLESSSTYHAYQTQLDAGMTMGSGSTWTGTNTRLMTQLPVFGAGYSVTNTRVVGGVTLTAPWTGTLPNLYVEPGGFLRPNGNTFVYTGSFTSTHNATTDGLRLNWAGDDVTLNGPATFTGSLAMNSTAMNGGTLRLKGSFSAPSSVAAFAPTGTKVVFEGTSLQSLTIGNSAGPSGNRFYDLEFRNPAGMNVSLVGGGALYTGRHLTVGTGGSLSVGATTNTVQVGGTLTLESGSTYHAYQTQLDAGMTMGSGSTWTGTNTRLMTQLPDFGAGYSVTNTRVVGGVTLTAPWTGTLPNLYVEPGGFLRPNGNAFVYTGNFTSTHNATTDGLRLNWAGDDVTLNGPATFTGSLAMNSTAMNGGTLRLKGSFSAPSSVAAFAPTGTKVVFEGTSLQSLTIGNSAGPSGNRFYDLEFRNPAGMNVSLVGGGALYTGRHLTVGTGGSLSVGATTNTVQVGGTLTLESSSTYHAYQTQLDAGMTMGSGSTWTGTNTRLMTQLPVFGAGYSVTNTRVVGGVTLTAPWTGTLPNLYVEPGGFLRPNANAFVYTGNFTSTHNATTDGLRLNWAGDDVTLNGPATFTGSLAMNSTAMNGGTLRLKGSFSAPSSVAAFAPTGTKVVFEGTSLQSLTIGNSAGPSGNRFYDLEFRNPAGMNVSLVGGGALYTGRHLTVGTGGSLSVGATTNTVQVGGTLTLESGSTYHAYQTQLDAGMTMGSGSTWTGTNTRLMTQLPDFGAGYSVTNTRVVGGVTLTAPWTGTLPNLYVEPGGFLRPNANAFVYTGNFTSTHNATTDGLRLNWAGDDVTLNGPATFTGSLAMNSTAMNGGTLRLKGSFSAPSSVAAFAPTGTKVVFEGTSLQSLTIGNSAGPSGNRFYDLEFRNPAGMNVSLVGGGALYTGRHLTVGTGGSLSVGATTNTVQVGGTLTLESSSTYHAYQTQLDAGMTMGSGSTWTGTNTRLMTQLPDFGAGYSVTNTRVVGGVTLTAPWTGTLPNLYVEPGGFLRPNANAFVYTGNFTSTHNATTDGLRLNWAGDDVTLNGPATFTGSLAMNSTAMNGGTLRLKGSFSAPSSVAAFAPTGTKVVFEGTSLQSLTIGNSAGPSGNRFYDLEFRNPAGMNVSLVGGGALYTGRHLTVGTGGSLSVGATTNTVQVGGTLTLESGSTYHAYQTQLDAGMTMGSGSTWTGTNTRLMTQLPDFGAGYSVTNTRVVGGVTLTAPWTGTLPNLYVEPGGFLRPNGNAFVYTGSFTSTHNATTDGLRLNSSADNVTINGPATFTGSVAMNSTAMNAGTLRLKGSFSAPSSVAAFAPTGATVVFDGSSAQSVTLASSSSSGNRFTNVQIANPAGVTWQNNTYASGVTTISGVLTNSSGRTSKSCGGLTISAGGTLQNSGATYNYSGTYTNNGTVTGNAPVSGSCP